MFDPTELPNEGFARLVAVMAQLRDPEQGCPWDLEQSLDSLKPFLIEECYEALDAIDALGPAAKATVCEPASADSGAIANHREELGDVLLQVIFQARLTEELGWFDVHDVARTIADKLVTRHPHVFGEQGEGVAAPGDRLTPTGVVERWEKIKQSDGRGALDGVPRNLPALLRGQRVGEKAARLGFDWQRPDQVLAKVDEELSELRQAIASKDRQAMADELGDLMFALTSLARHLEIDAEQSLRTTLDRFSERFRHVERHISELDGDPPAADALEALWLQAKRHQANGLQEAGQGGRNEP